MITLANDAWKVRGVSLAEKAVLVRLADRADNLGICFPGLTSLAEDLCVQPRTVSRAVVKLVEHGHVSIIQGATATQSRRYRVHPRTPALDAPPVLNAPPASNAGGTSNERTRGTALDAGGGLYETHPNHQATTIEPPVTTTAAAEPSLFGDSEPKRRHHRAKWQVPEGFAEFWKAYPKKDQKKDAESAWKRLRPSPDVQANILADVARRRLSPDWLKEGGQFIPNPATYLKGERWNDEGVTIPGVVGSTGAADRTLLEAEQRRILSQPPGARTRSDEARLKEIGQALNGVTTV